MTDGQPEGSIEATKELKKQGKTKDQKEMKSEHLPEQVGVQYYRTEVGGAC